MPTYLHFMHVICDLFTILLLKVDTFSTESLDMEFTLALSDYFSSCRAGRLADEGMWGIER